MSDAELEKLRELCGEHVDGSVKHICMGSEGYKLYVDATHTNSKGRQIKHHRTVGMVSIERGPLAELFAAAPEAIPALLDTIAELKKEVTVRDAALEMLAETDRKSVV